MTPSVIQLLAGIVAIGSVMVTGLALGSVLYDRKHP
jgi:hypothetical protein